MKYVYVVYVKSSEIELCFAYLNQSEANTVASHWGEYATVHQVQVAA